MLCDELEAVLELEYFVHDHDQRGTSVVGLGSVAPSAISVLGELGSPELGLGSSHVEKAFTRLARKVRQAGHACAIKSMASRSFYCTLFIARTVHAGLLCL